MIDKYPVTLHLYKTGHQYNGDYYYNSRQELIYFSGEDTTKADSIRLACYLPDQETIEYFDFHIENNELKGQWVTTTTTNSKSYSFSAKEDPAAPMFDYVYSEGTTPLRPNLSGSPAASFMMKTVWPTGNSPREDFFKKIIRESFDEKNSTEDIGKIFLRQKKKFFSGYINDNKDMKDEDLKDAVSYNLDISDEMTVVYRSAGLIMFAHSNYVYSGGAHGIYGTKYIPVDLVNNKKLDLNSIMTATGKQQLPKLLEKYFRKSYSLKPTDSLSEAGLFENRIVAGDNFYTTAKGICFSYMPYEIGPYAMGEIKIFIPFTELNAYLNPAFKQLIQ